MKSFISRCINTVSRLSLVCQNLHYGFSILKKYFQVLHKLVGQAASRAGDIQRVTPDGARLIGLALEEYVKNLVSKAIHAASHRNIQFKDDEHRIKVNDVKAQLKIIGGFL